MRRLPPQAWSAERRQCFHRLLRPKQLIRRRSVAAADGPPLWGCRWGLSGSASCGGLVRLAGTQPGGIFLPSQYTSLRRVRARDAPGQSNFGRGCPAIFHNLYVNYTSNYWKMQSGSNAVYGRKCLFNSAPQKEAGAHHRAPLRRIHFIDANCYK